ncbi:MAG: hypothetical protein OI74_05645 [Gammaproteobacteria bacterium (ex Lamellibrachia satsuma)]|nr:MAG: hypothetical protein OI74_05645 [Gammaproteobacteria bacterium (ex Lamellibrachia satsuma)]RRS37323.1 MAG: hypothetical protein NV67_01900 [Gammaproteobacteria bacterium (ex Lamellibrachia satsuma)]
MIGNSLSLGLIAGKVDCMYEISRFLCLMNQIGGVSSQLISANPVQDNFLPDVMQDQPNLMAVTNTAR